MSEKINRASLLKIALLLRPALAKGDYIPALQHIHFKEGYATAFNDISAISVKADNIDVERCLPGETLIRALQSFNAESIDFQQNGAEVLIVSGRSKLKVPTLGNADFPLVWPEEKGKSLIVDGSILKGIERCLMNVGNDPTHPECMGVTLDCVKGNAVLFATDNFTISRYATQEEISLPGDAPVIMPTFFCEQLVSLGKFFSEEEIELTIRAGSLTAELGNKAKLFSRTLVDNEPLDFPEMLDKQLKGISLKKELVKIPDAFDAALSRALLVLEREVDKVTTLTMNDAGFRMLSSSSAGEADDKMKVDGEVSFDAPDEVHVDPALVARATKSAAIMGLLPKAMVLADEDAGFVHLISYCSK